jgi:hypothetical protein
MDLLIKGTPSSTVRKIQSGGCDAYGQSAQVHTAKGVQNPCRHCLQLIAEGEEKLVLSYRPFDELQPYAETGPIFLHKHQCRQYKSDKLPEWFEYLNPAIIRGYDKNNWIRYDTGDVVRGSELDDTCRTILRDESIAYVHIRSKFNCFLCQVERAAH